MIFRVFWYSQHLCQEIYYNIKSKTKKLDFQGFLCFVLQEEDILEYNWNRCRKLGMQLNYVQLEYN